MDPLKTELHRFRLMIVDTTHTHTLTLPHTYTDSHTDSDTHTQTGHKLTNNQNSENTHGCHIHTHMSEHAQNTYIQKH